MVAWLARWAVCVALLCGPVLASGQVLSESQETEKIAEEVADALWWGDFPALNRLHERYRQPGQRLADGWPRLGPFRSGIERAMRGPDENADAFYGQLQALTLQWARDYPRSGLAHALHAMTLTGHAWKVRGSGYANTVPPEAWADFERLMKQAQTYLAQHAEAAQSSTLTHRRVAGPGQGGELERTSALAGARRRPAAQPCRTWCCTGMA